MKRCGAIQGFGETRVSGEGGAREGRGRKRSEGESGREQTTDGFRQLNLLIIIKFDNYVNNLIIVELAYYIRYYELLAIL